MEIKEEIIAFDEKLYEQNLKENKFKKPDEKDGIGDENADN